MSIHYRTIENEFLSILQALKSEEDILLRMKYVRNIEKTAHKMLRELKRETSYLARSKYASKDIATVSGADNAEIDYWAKCHADAKGLPVMTRRRRQNLDEYMDLTGR